ncbi:MAG TPA: lipopolysaccharide heptosyltransferase II [Dehalococcoidia bacterium]
MCVRLDTIGDVLMTTPAIRALKRGAADRRITLLTSHSGAEAARLVPEIDDVITYDAPWMKPESGSRRELEMAQLLRERSFDAAAIFTVYTQSALPASFLCRLAGIPLQLAHCRENPYALLTDWVRETEPETGIRHEVQRQLDLVATVGCTVDDDRLSLEVPPAATHRIERLLEDCGIDGSRPWCVMHPGATAASRRYPPGSFAAAADELARDGWRIVLTGAPAEAALVASVRRAMRAPALSLTGALDLGEMAALLASAPLLISNNSGPVHIAAAVGTPVVDLYALTNPQHTPWRVPSRVLSHDVPCRWCYRSICPEGHQNCLRLVEASEVAAAARELFAETHDARRLVGAQP